MYVVNVLYVANYIMMTFTMHSFLVSQSYKKIMV